MTNNEGLTFLVFHSYELLIFYFIIKLLFYHGSVCNSKAFLTSSVFT